MLHGLRPGEQVVASNSISKPTVAQESRTQAPQRTRSSLGGLVGLAVAIGIVFVFYKVKTGSSLRTAISGPETIEEETYTLDEGQARTYSFSFAASRRIHVSVHAQPKRVNVFLMTESDLAEYNRARQKVLGGEYHYIPALSAQGQTDVERESQLPAGRYTVVIERPNDSVLITDKTTAHVVIKGM